MLWYETDAVVSLCAVTKLCFDCLRFCLLLWRWGWPVNDWNVSSCLLYTCETAYYNMVAAVKREHHLPGQYSLPAHWTAQTRRPSFSTRGWAGESSRQWISGKATFDCSSSSQVWVCKHLTLAKVVHHLRLSRRNRPAHFFAATLQNFSCKQVCSPHTMRVQAQGEQLHQAHLVIPCTVITYIPSCMRFGQHFVTVTSDYDHVLCASVETLCCVPLCTATK